MAVDRWMEPRPMHSSLFRNEAAAYFDEMAGPVELADDDAQAASLRACARALRAGTDDDHPATPSRWLREFAAWGAVPELEAKRLSVPVTLRALGDFLGPGNAALLRRLRREAGIVSAPQFRKALLRKEASLRLLLGDEPFATLSDRLEARALAPGFWPRHTAQRPSQEIRQWKAWAALNDIALAGEARRGCELIERALWVASADDPNRALGRLAALPAARLEGDPADRVRIEDGNRAPTEILVVESGRHAARTVLETGARAHLDGLLGLIAERTGSPQEGLPIPRSEEEAYALADLPWIPPELREGRGEIARAAKLGVPRLVGCADLRGVFHVHTDWSDGRASIRELTEAARARGWEYLGIADHSQAAGYANGLTPERLAAQAEEIARVQREFPGVRILRGVECDVLLDGRLDFDDALLASLDFVIASIHTGLDMEVEPLTDRVVRAIRHPATTILGHPSGRLLRERGASSLDWLRVFQAAAEEGTLLEFNTSPERLDLDWRLIRAATSLGARLCVNPDAHRLEAFDALAYGIETARKGWLVSEQVFNTLSRESMEAQLHEKRKR
ncbi:MAG: hypothetical protein KA123_01505 [Candidatus Eisenbacteria bacterium]|nr:hypothetical protein [Candidatus Eisenbacteria bacterium]